jgi:FAD/FMN-containing dehydrogenase
MLASGDIVECSRDKQPELFAHVMGGYGLFGIILDLDVEMTKNLLVQPEPRVLPAEAFPKAFLAAVNDPTILMAYGRLEVARATFFQEANLTTYRAVSPQPTPLPAATRGNALNWISSDLYREQIGDEEAKVLRWFMETRVLPDATSGQATRNSLMNEPVSNLTNPFSRRTDILHEYFVAPDRFVEFLAACREVIPPAKAEFINVTLRYLAPDTTSILAHSPVARISAVMSFSQEISTEGEVDMLQLTERLIERVVSIGGAFYLPYRLHARRDQVRRAYPKAEAFVAKKRELDPGLLFRNAMWGVYFA